MNEDGKAQQKLTQVFRVDEWNGNLLKRTNETLDSQFFKNDTLPMLEWATAALGTVNKCLRCLAELKAATLTHCEYCTDLGSQATLLVGLNDEQLLALPRNWEGELFTDLEKLVLDYAVGMNCTPVDVSVALLAKMRLHFNETQQVNHFEHLHEVLNDRF